MYLVCMFIFQDGLTQKVNTMLTRHLSGGICVSFIDVAKLR